MLELADTWRLYGSREQLAAVQNGSDPATVSETWAVGEAKWRERRAKYLLYGADPLTVDR